MEINHAHDVPRYLDVGMVTKQHGDHGTRHNFYQAKPP